MSTIIKFINNGVLVGCGGSGSSGSSESGSSGSGSSESGSSGSGQDSSNKILDYNSKIYFEGDSLIITIIFSEIIILESGSPFLSLNNEFILNYEYGSGTKEFIFKIDNLSFQDNIYDIELEYFNNDAVLKKGNENFNFTLEKQLINIVLFKNYSQSTEFNNNQGLVLHKALFSYQNDNFGEKIKVGVVDSGLDRNHSDFRAKVIDGQDYGDEKYYITEVGTHGSHVGGIISANYDQKNVSKNIHGYSYLSMLIDFRVFNNSGYWTASNYDMKMLPQKAIEKGTNILNNSWGYVGHYIDGRKYYREKWSDYNINSFLSNDEVYGYLNQGLQNSLVNVFASGNDSYTNPGIMPGLPVIHPQLKDIWICVISCDQDGKEAYYSNRAGIANLWSITGHGGDYYTDGGVLSVQSNGSYVKMQGTSMACPTITGGLALIMNKFLNNLSYPNMTPQLCIDRLFQTADYDGLKAGISDSNDILVKEYNRSKFTSYKDASELTQDQKQKIFGYGKMNLEEALQDMDSQQFQDLLDFSDDRDSQIANLSANFKSTTNKFINSVDKERILL